MNEDIDIAIVGIGCMFPGADNVDEFWQVLINGEDRSYLKTGIPMH